MITIITVQLDYSPGTVVPLMSGPPDEGTPRGRGQRTAYVGYMSLLKWTVSENTAKNEIF